MARHRIIKIPKDRLRYLYVVKKLSPIQIAKEFNCSKRTIFSRLYGYNIPIRYKIKRADITKDKLKELYVNRKLSLDKIAKMFNCSKSTIWTKLRQFNIEVRTRSEASKKKYKVKIPKELLKCFYLNKKLDTKEIARKFNCSRATIVRRLRRCDVSIRRIRIDIPRNRLEYLYRSKKMTIYQIAREFNCSEVTILNRLNQYNIPIWRNELRKGKYKIQISKDKLKDLYVNKKLTISEIVKIFNCSPGTVYKRLRKDDLVRSVSEALKGRPSVMKGKHHTSETKKKLRKATIEQLASGKMKRKDTFIELEMERELKRNNIYYQKQVPLYNITVVDFYLPRYKIVIYTDGDYWHNLPKVKKRDEQQNKILKQNGYKVFRFWEHEINKSTKGCINEILENIRIRNRLIPMG